MICHASGGHGPGRDRRHWGVLCDSCWEWCARFVEKLTGRRPRDPSLPAVTPKE